jgi:hypothetical protein
MTMLRATLIATACCSLFAAGRAEAEPSESAIYAGSITLGRNNPMPGVDVVGIGWGMSYRDPELVVTEGLAALGVRARPIPGLWLEIGAGAASTRSSAEVAEYRTADETGVAPAAMVGTGVEFELIGVPVAVTMHAGAGVDGEGAPCAFHASLGFGGTW